MSCNLSSPELTTVEILDHQFGRVSGCLNRLKGTSGLLRAIPDEGYRFVSWLSSDETVYSTSNPLTIRSWDNIQLQPVFEAITLTLQDFQSEEAVDALVWYLEYRGLVNDTSNVRGASYSMTNSPKYYSAGGYTTASGTHDRFASTTPKTLYPMTYGFNYGDTTTGSTYQRLGKGTYNPSTNTSTGVFLRDPATHTKRDSVTIPEIIHRRGAQVPVDHIYRWEHFRDVGNSGTYHSNGLQFPMLQYAKSTSIIFDPRGQNDDWIDLTGLDDIDPFTVYCRYFDRNESGFRDLDAVSGWRNLHTFNYITAVGKWSRAPEAFRTQPSRSPRPLEGFSYCNNLTFLHMASNTWDPDSFEDIHSNPGWVTQYNNTPHSGDILRVTRYSPIVTIHTNQNQNITDHTLATTYFTNLKGIYNHQSYKQSSGVDLTDTLNANFKDHEIETYYNYGQHSTYVTSFDFLSGGNLTQFVEYSTNDQYRLNPVNTKFTEGSSICEWYLSSKIIDGMIVDPLFGETVAIHADFSGAGSNQLPTQDQSRYQLSIDYSESGVTTTSIN